MGHDFAKRILGVKVKGVTEQVPIEGDWILKVLQQIGWESFPFHASSDGHGQGWRNGGDPDFFAAAQFKGSLVSYPIIRSNIVDAWLIFLVSQYDGVSHIFQVNKLHDRRETGQYGSSGG